MASDYTEDREATKRAGAEALADRAAAARADGDEALADRYLDEALHTDPEALGHADATERHASGADAPDPADSDADADAAVHAITGTVEPGSDAPSRAGISGSGSGADNM